MTSLSKLKSKGVVKMHLGIALFTIWAAWRLGDWRNWEKYHSTMAYITIGGLLYEYITGQNSLWLFHPDFLYNQKITVIVYSVLTMPLTVLIFLSRYPEDVLKKQAFYITKWICVYTLVELVLLWTGRISYQHGWSIYYSVLFDIMMFIMLRLHYKKPLLSYGISILIIIFLIYWFDITIK
jgi:hypothetical protein